MLLLIHSIDDIFIIVSLAVLFMYHSSGYLVPIVLLVYLFFIPVHRLSLMLIDAPLLDFGFNRVQSLSNHLIFLILSLVLLQTFLIEITCILYEYLLATKVIPNAFVVISFIVSFIRIVINKLSVQVSYHDRIITFFYALLIVSTLVI